MRKQWGIVLLLAVLLLALGLQGGLGENSQISGMVWVEKTVDGSIGSGESGLSGVQITLEKQDEGGAARVAVNTTTDKTGNFVFSSLSEGLYRLRVEAASGYRFTYHGMESAALPAQGNVSYTPWFAVGGGESLQKNVGLTKSYCTVSLIAFEDSNANGGRMQSEPLVRGVQAQLIYDYQGETYVVASAQTDRQGAAQMKELSPGTYRVRVALPEHYAVGPLGQKINSFYNCILAQDDGTGVSDYFSLPAKESVSMGVGMVRTGSLTGKAWFDANYNGLWDNGEAGLTDAVITLYSPPLGFSRTTQADARGVYTFLGLQPGDYRLEFQLPEGMIFTYPGASLLSDTADRASLTVNVMVDVTTDLGAVGAMPAAGLSLAVYQDENLNGLWDEGEAGIPGVAVIAIQGGKKVETAVTDETGAAVFNALRGGDTTLQAQLPEGWLFTPDQEGLFPVSGAMAEAQAAVTLDGTQQDAQYRAAAIPAAAISGMLFEDADNSGLYRADSRLLPGYAVQAVDQAGQTAAETVTDENGAYTLYPLLPGDYTVRFVLDEAYVASPYAAASGVQASHILTQTPEYGETEALSLAPGQRAEGMDGGVFRAGLVEGSVLVDEAYAPAETGMPGITVWLLGSDGGPVSDYSYGVTDASGAFFIKGVLPGAYALAYDLPDNGLFTAPSTTEKRYISEGFTVESGSQIEMPALRGVLTSSLSGVILHDDGAAAFSALVSLRGHNVSKVVEIHTDSDGSFTFDGLLPDTYTLSVSLPQGLIFGQLEGSLFGASYLSDAEADIELGMDERLENVNALAATPVSLFGIMYYDDNLSGLQDEEEYGAESRTLTLWANGEALFDAETDDSGSFFFGSLIPGRYDLHIQLDENEQLLNWPDAIHSGTEWIVPVSLTRNLPLVLPVMRFASVSGQVWSLDGTQNGVAGIPVSLLDAQGVLLATVETGSQGDYTFGGLMPGQYALSAQLPQGYLFARAQDTQERESYVQSQPDGGVFAIGFDVPMGDDLSGIDIGMGTMGSIGDRAWLDENGNGMQDTDEPGMPGIVIALYQHGEQIASATTDEYGRYSLENLYPGEYEMQVTMHPELKATLRQEDFPLVASILPESDGLTVTATGVAVPSGGANLHCDLGFQLRKKGVYPAAMDLTPKKDWRPYSER